MDLFKLLHAAPVELEYSAVQCGFDHRDMIGAGERDTVQQARCGHALWDII